MELVTTIRKPYKDAGEMKVAYYEKLALIRNLKLHKSGTFHNYSFFFGGGVKH